ncbi:hypothetical protein QYM36_014218 [Artemia franciscana]|uniref:Uncharacterized protein n=1 Tax=Artemia franciscana TaxID=6661 RepID=A0AA88L0S4_ARTSF|nr:hypothetical protein QYM36_014218 [Artemia franciscana]
MNLASALLVIYLSATTSQPAKVLTEKTKVGRVPRTTRTGSLVRYRFSSRLPPYFKRSYILPERAEDLALEELLKDVSEDSQEKLNTIAQQNSEEDKDNENDATEEEENEGDEEKEKHRLSSKHSFFAFNDLPLT